jgi:hypothetical protein
MAKIKLRAGKDAVEQAESGGDFGDPPKPGLYHLKLESVDQMDNKDGQGKHLSCRWRPVGIGREGAKPSDRLGVVFDRVSLTSEAAEWARARFAIALGAKPNRSGAVTLDIELDPTKPGSPVGTAVCLGRVARDEDLEGNYRPKLGWLGPLDATAESDDEEGFEDDEEEATEAFDDDEDVGGEEDDEILTEEDLDAMEPKEIAALLPDFDLSADDLKVKVKGKLDVNKSKAKMIAAILEAQGAEEEGDPDEDPF